LSIILLIGLYFSGASSICMIPLSVEAKWDILNEAKHAECNYATSPVVEEFCILLIRLDLNDVALLSPEQREAEQCDTSPEPKRDERVWDQL